MNFGQFIHKECGCVTTYMQTEKKCNKKKQTEFNKKYLNEYKPHTHCLKFAILMGVMLNIGDSSFFITSSMDIEVKTMVTVSFMPQVVFRLC